MLAKQKELSCKGFDDDNCKESPQSKY